MWDVDMADVGSMAMEPRGHSTHEAFPGNNPSIMQHAIDGIELQMCDVYEGTIHHVFTQQMKKRKSN
jgi:hypothetical protein